MRHNHITMQNSAPPTPPAMFTRAEADRCVMCGLCLPHCPTFRLTRSEGESPRGRLSLMVALANGSLACSEKLTGHLDRCLGCGSCERACPSGVPFGALLDETRARLQPEAKGKSATWAESLLDSGRHLRTIGHLASFAQRSGLATVGARVSPLARVGLLAKAPPKWREFYPSPTQERDQVGLFLGCAQQLFDADSLRDLIQLLGQLGVSVAVPTAQGCCGAIAQKRGDHAQAEKLQQANQQAFEGVRMSALLHNGSGCLAHMRQHWPSQPVVEICHWLMEKHEAWAPRLQPQSMRVALHEPCTHRNAPGGTQAVRALLNAIPELEVVSLDAGFGCCGAAGSYMLEQPAMAQALREPLIAWLVENRIETLVTTNVGCNIHLRDGMRQRKQAFEVRHPASLLLQAIANG